MITELRCPGTMHAKLDGEVLEVKCRRKSCGYHPGVVVLHRFDVHTGKLTGTMRLADPKSGGNHAAG